MLSWGLCHLAVAREGLLPHTPQPEPAQWVPLPHSPMAGLGGGIPVPLQLLPLQHSGAQILGP